MNKIIPFLSRLKIDSISEIQYTNKSLITAIAAFLVFSLFGEGEIIDEPLIILSGFLLFATLFVAARYKDSKQLAKMHYFFAIGFFCCLVCVAGIWCLPIPILLACWFYFKHKKRDLHLLIFEVALFINVQILILI